MKRKSIYSSLFTLLLVFNVSAEPLSVLIVKSHNTPLYNNVCNGIIDNINDKKITMQAVRNLNALDTATIEQNSIIITVGSDAAQRIFSLNPTRPVLSLLIPKTSFQSLKKHHPENTQAGAIFVDQPIARTAKQIKKFLPKTKTVGIISSLPQTELRNKINALKKYFNTHHVNIKDQKNILDVFRNISIKSDVILADPDSLVYNKDTIKRILISSYHNNTPLVGYSDALTRAGALISVYSPPYYIGKEAAEILKSLNSQTNFSLKEKYPKYYKVSVNERVARSMQVHLSQTDQIESILVDRQ